MHVRPLIASVLAVAFVAASAFIIRSLGDVPADAGQTSSTASSSVSPQCEPYRCADGTEIASCTADGHVINYFADPCLTHGGYASASSEGSAETSCVPLKKKYDATVADAQACRTDADCALFIFSCPFVTCGTAVASSAEPDVLSAAQEYADCRQREGSPLACAMCARMTVSCEQGKCVTKEGM